MSQKDPITIRLDPVHLALLDDWMPYFGNSRPEVVRYIVLDWLRLRLGDEGLRAKKAIK